MSLHEKINSKKAVIAIVGAGYVGLPNAINFADAGYKVIAADINPHAVELLSKGQSHIKDKVLEEGVKRINKADKLKATTDVAGAVKEADAVIISVPTPTIGNLPDLKFLENSCKLVAKGLGGNEKLVVTESTTPPGTCRNFTLPILENESGLKCGKDFFLGHCLERINPGDNEHTLKNIPRVLGGIDEKSGELIEELYKSVTNAKIIRASSPEVAETAKLVENIQRDINIAYINEVALACEKIGVDAKEVIEACKTKWNWYNAMPGPGVGGHCLPNNAYYFVSVAEKKGFHPQIIPLARIINDSMPHHVVELVESALNEARKPLNGSEISVLGVAYKPNTDDARQSPAYAIVRELREKGARITIHDPHVRKENLDKIHSVQAKSLEEALKAKDALVLLCAHDEYKKITPQKIRANAVIDAVFVIDALEARKQKKIFRRVGTAIT
ncbi:MAG: nucleotide sugar dehydrogenase [Candidatus Micrarchaeia archaeon]